ncbi:MAG: glycosyltransferase family 4 protein, partial [Solirubrobacterales bacterium]|nr:glycosyltransferase family 4 protein [Solirubrobacterales bacterium]
MGQDGALDVLIVSLGSTAGLRRADEELQLSLERAGASVAVAQALPPPERRTLMLTDLSWARAARAAARQALERIEGAPPPAIVYSSTTAALLWPRPGAIRFDAPSAGNRTGRHGLWQRPLERVRLRRASLLLPWSEGALGELPADMRGGDRALVLAVAVEPSAESAGTGPASHPRRDLAAITYAANPSKKG